MPSPSGADALTRHPTRPDVIRASFARCFNKLPLELKLYIYAVNIKSFYVPINSQKARERQPSTTPALEADSQLRRILFYCQNRFTLHYGYYSMTPGEDHVAYLKDMQKNGSNGWDASWGLIREFEQFDQTGMLCWKGNRKGRKLNNHPGRAGLYERAQEPEPASFLHEAVVSWHFANWLKSVEEDGERDKLGEEFYVKQIRHVSFYSERLRVLVDVVEADRNNDGKRGGAMKLSGVVKGDGGKRLEDLEGLKAKFGEALGRIGEGMADGEMQEGLGREQWEDVERLVVGLFKNALRAANASDRSPEGP
ncbi:hypothetical protein BST61_g1548 [Cercospora zeina]